VESFGFFEPSPHTVDEGASLEITLSDEFLMGNEY
jgi:hypothetical protein